MLLRSSEAGATGNDAVERLVVTTFFPRPAEPQRGIFVLNLVRALRKTRDVGVVSPSPYAPLVGRLARFRARGVRLRDDVVEGIPVARPAFLAWPGAEAWNGGTYGVALGRHLSRRTEARPFVLHGHCLYPDGVGVALAASRLGLPFLLTAHGSDVNVYSRRTTLRPQIRWALRRARGIIAVSGALRDAIRSLAGPSGPPVEHIPCAGFDPGAFAPRSKAEARAVCDLPQEGRVVLFLGHLVATKGVDLLLEAWARLSARRVSGPGDHDRLVIAGSGDGEQALRRRAESLGLGDRARFLGTIPHGRVADWIGAADLVCLPSRNEGTPNVIVEALAAGRPVVASRVGGIPEVVREGENGLLVPPEDAVALAEALGAAFERGWPADRLRATVMHLTWESLALRDAAFADSCLAPEGV